MGMDTDWNLKADKEITQKMLDVIDEITGYHDWWYYTDQKVMKEITMTAKWYDWLIHMPKISKKFPDCVFILNGIDEQHTVVAKNLKWQNGVEIVQSQKIVKPGKAILKLKVNSRTLRKTMTVKKYLLETLLKFATNREMFSAKRPFGDSDWDGDIAVALVKAGLIPGTLDDDENLIDVEWNDVYKKVVEAVEAL